MTAPVITGRTPESAEDIEAIRQIRNAGREWMTGSTDYITEADQRFWWEGVRELPRSEFQLLLYMAEDLNSDQTRCGGYGMLSRRDGRLWASLGVHPDLRGRGIGTQIYRDLVRRAPDKYIHAWVREGNLASLSAARKAGFYPVLERDGFLFLVATKGPAFPPAAAPEPTEPAS